MNFNQFNNVFFIINMFKVKFIYVNGLGLFDVGINVMINVMNMGFNVYFIYDFYGFQLVINKVVFGEIVFIYCNFLYSIQMVVSWSNDNNVVI